MDNRINNNGYDYVDLGLPSGTLWATCNVGASKPSESGLYFQWGDTIGYAADQVGIGDEQKKFASDRSDCKWYSGGAFTKYKTLGTTLKLEDDAAHVNMGGAWHMPNPAQIKELIDNTNYVWATLDDGVKGMKFTSKKDKSKSIFIPAAGGAWDGSVQGSGGYGVVWSSVLGMDFVSNGQGLYFNSGDVDLCDGGYRCDGLSVRGVISGQNDASKNNKHNTAMNLVEILKNAPIGTELWSYACGSCYLKEILEYSNYPIVCKMPTNNGQFQSIAFTKEGKRDTIYPNGQCVLFPSKDNQDWGTFKAQKVKHFEPFQKVLHIDRNNYNKNVWKADLYSHYNKEEDRYYLASGFICRYDEVIPYKGNEDKLGKEVEK